MPKSVEERLTRVESLVADLLTNVAADGKDIKALKKQIRRLKDDRDKLEHEIQLLKREV